VFGCAPINGGSGTSPGHNFALVTAPTLDGTFAEWLQEQQMGNKSRALFRVVGMRSPNGINSLVAHLETLWVS